jgi:hypothetical protein
VHLLLDIYISTSPVVAKVPGLTLSAWANSGGLRTTVTQEALWGGGKL